MKVGIYAIKDPNGKPFTANLAYEAILDHNGIASERLCADQPDFWSRVAELSLFIMRFQQFDNDLQIARDVLPVVEEVYRIPCFPNQATAWHYDDKVKQAHLLKAHGFPITESWVFYNKEAALEWASTAQFPVVFKLRGGAGSQNVILVESTRQAQRLIRRMFGRGIRPGRYTPMGSVRLRHFNVYRELHQKAGNLYRRSKGLDASPFWATHKNYVLFQKFLPRNDCDTRVTVIGERAFAFRRLVRDNDFRASGSGRIDYDRDKIDPKCLELAFAVSRQMGFQSMAYDFLVNEAGDPEFCEISYAYVSRAVRDCPGYWDPELNWRQGNFWPEHLHLVDALGIPDLKVPELDY